MRKASIRVRTAHQMVVFALDTSTKLYLIGAKKLILQFIKKISELRVSLDAGLMLQWAYAFSREM